MYSTIVNPIAELAHKSQSEVIPQVPFHTPVDRHSTRVVLIRHGQSTFNAQKRFQGSCDDSVLTEKGIQEAYRTGVALRQTRLDAVYVSPLQRAKATAHAIYVGMGLDIHQLPETRYCSDLREVDLPHWQGLPYQYVRENFPEDYRCWKEQPHQFRISLPPCTPIAVGVAASAPVQVLYPLLELRDRVRQFWRSVLPRHRGQTIAVVSHGGTIRALLMEALGLPVEQFHALQQSNCGISQLWVSHRTGSALLESMNNTTHLGETLPKLKDGKQGLRLLLVAAHPGQACPALSHHLKTTEIDFCLNEDEATAQRIAQTLLQHHGAVQIQVARQNFAMLWQHHIASRRTPVSSPSPTRPTTGLVVANPAVIQQMVAQTVGLPGTARPPGARIEEMDVSGLAIGSTGLSVIYYPLLSPTPVLQAFNFM